ncbi:unnamed protein product [Owenia fusiformis]|uniref:VWFA domain-containing protein n=1 Tax=Owenia fusiformis TaxID=6347 RepID=A0A8S4MZ12_OWEFU|nr:unnamed protein product [Owenia fusiformis]
MIIKTVGSWYLRRVMLMLLVTLVAACAVVKGQTTGTCPSVVGFPKNGGGEVKSLPDTGGNWANLMTDNVFPCNGVVKSWTYYRNNPTDAAFVSVWRIVQNGVFKLIFKTELPATTVGKHTVPVSPEAPVQKGDFIGIHFSRSASKCGVANANLYQGEHPELLLEDYFFTLNVGFYDDQFTVGAEFNFAPNNQMNFVKRTYAIQAEFEGDDATASQDPIFDNAKCHTLDAVPVNALMKELPQSGDNWANLQVGDIFPCDGVVTGYEYYRHPGSKGTAFVGIWEYSGPGKYEYTLKHKTALPWDASQGEQGGLVKVSIPQEAYLRVNQLDVLGVFYSKDDPVGVISNANPWQAATDNISYTTMYDTLNIKSYDEDFKVGGAYDWDQPSLWIVPRLYALKALFKEECGPDVVFAVDNSYSINRGVLKNVTVLMANIVNQFEVGPDEREAQFAALVFDKTVKDQFFFDTNNTKDGVLDNIAGLYIELDGKRTRTDRALKKISKNYLNKNGDRPNNKNFVCIITDGVTYPKRFKSKAVALARKLEGHPYNADVIVVGLPHRRAKDPGTHWNDLATDPDEEHMFLPPIYEVAELSLAKAIASKIASFACNKKAPVACNEE